MKPRNKSIAILILLSILMCFILVETALADSHVFTVLISKGNLSKTGKNKTEAIKLNVDSKLEKNDIIKAEGDVYLCLVTKDGAFIEINKPGKYKVNDLKEKVVKVDSNIFISYIEFLKQSLKEKPKKPASYIGGREKSIADNELQAYMPKTTKIFHDDLTLNWYKNPQIKDFVLTIKDENNNIILNKKLSDTTYKLNIGEFTWERNKCYYWKVTDADNTANETDSYCIYYISDEESVNVKKKIEKYLNKDLSIFESLILAKYFESNGFIYDANNWYYKTYWSNKDIEELENIYHNFLLMNSTKIE